MSSIQITINLGDGQRKPESSTQISVDRTLIQFSTCIKCGQLVRAGEPCKCNPAAEPIRIN